MDADVHLLRACECMYQFSSVICLHFEIINIRFLLFVVLKSLNFFVGEFHFRNCNGKSAVISKCCQAYSGLLFISKCRTHDKSMFCMIFLRNKLQYCSQWYYHALPSLEGFSFPCGKGCIATLPWIS